MSKMATLTVYGILTYVLAAGAVYDLCLTGMREMGVEEHDRTLATIASIPICWFLFGKPMFREPNSD